jgi:hypothetical protein
MSADLTADLAGEQVQRVRTQPFPDRPGREDSTYPEFVPEMQRDTPRRSQQ